MVSTAAILCLVLICGVSSESPASSDQWWIDSSVSEEHASDQEWKADDPLESLHYELPSKKTSHDAEWTAYSPEVYPVFRKAVKELAASEHGILILWDTLNRPEPSKEFFDHIFNAYDRLTTEDSVSVSTEEQSASEVEDPAYTSHDDETTVEYSSPEYHSVSAQEEEGSEVYYTTDSSTLEAMLTDDAIYASTVSPVTQEATAEETEHLFVTSEVYEEPSVFEEEESKVDEQELKIAEAEGWQNILKRSGEIFEDGPEALDGDQCEGCPLQVGSIRGIPGVHFPNYDDIPITSFSCADKRIPGFYADLETGCQVFHVCWPHRRESFLCPIGTLFNQAILACDYWYSTNCSLSTHFFDLTTISPKPASERPPTRKPKPTRVPGYSTSTPKIITEDYERPIEIPDERPHVDLDWFRVSKFVPVKSKVTIYSKHSLKKPGSKFVVKQKHDVLPLVEEFLELTKNVAKNAVRVVPNLRVDVVKPSIPKTKVVKVRPVAKLVPCSKVTQHTPTPSLIVKKPEPIPTLDPRFIVRPAEGKPVVHVKKGKLVVPKVLVKQTKPINKVAFKTAKPHVSGIVMKALDVAGNVLQRDILDLARQALAESHVKSVKTKH